MKRSLEEVEIIRSQFKRPFHSSGGAQAADALGFLEKVKETFFLHHQTDKYQQFIQIMKAFKSQIISTAGLVATLKKLFEGHSDLVHGFNTFLPDGYKINIAHDQDEDKDEDSTTLKSCVDFVNKIRKRFQDNDDHVYKSFLDAMNNCREDHTTIANVHHLFDDHPDLLEEFTTFLPDHSLLHNDAKYHSKSTNYCHEEEGQKRDEDIIMFICEEDRYEMDMLLGTVSKTANHVEELLQSINLGIPVRIEDHLKGINLKCIEHIYGDYGLNVIDILRKNPNLALPVILPRLKQKQDEWTRAHSDYFNNIWADVYAKNQPLQIKAGKGHRLPNPLSVAAGLGHSLAICQIASSEVTGDAKSIVSWGWNQSSQLGREGTENLPLVVEGLAGKTPISVSRRRAHSIALTSNGELWVWGCGKSGRLVLGLMKLSLLVESLEGCENVRFFKLCH